MCKNITDVGRKYFHKSSPTGNDFMKSRLSSLKHCDVYSESRVQNDKKGIKRDQKIMSILSLTSILVKVKDGFENSFMSSPCSIW